MIALLKKYREIILYVFFGGLTTLVNIAGYYVFTRVIPLSTTAATVCAWVLSVLFAYATNRSFVFKSKERTVKGVLREMGAFFGARLATGGLDLLVMYVFVDVLHFHDMVVKILSNVVVIVLNYILSKLFIFKKQKGEKQA